MQANLIVSGTAPITSSPEAVDMIIASNAGSIAPISGLVNSKLTTAVFRQLSGNINGIQHVKVVWIGETKWEIHHQTT